MKTRNRFVNRKLPYDSEIECSTTGNPKKQKLDPSDMFTHNSSTNVDNCGLKILLNMDPFHGDSSSIEISLTQTANMLAHDQQYGTIDIPSQPVIVGLTSMLSGSRATVEAGVSSIDLSTTSYMTTVVCSQQRQLYPHGLQQFPLNKGNIPFTSDAIPSSFVRVPNPKHNHVAQR
nr:hypothetical protein [Tanacetum cinerariifolium]